MLDARYSVSILCFCAYPNDEIADAHDLSIFLISSRNESVYSGSAKEQSRHELERRGKSWSVRDKGNASIRQVARSQKPERFSLSPRVQISIVPCAVTNSRKWRPQFQPKANGVP
jgi:hypothetical protein